MKPLVRWFRNGHEHRNYWLRFGLMRLHRAGKVVYREERIEACPSAGFDPALAGHEHRHTSVIALEAGQQRVRCIVDSEDSFMCMAGIIEHADVYFCAGYNSRFFREKRFDPPYDWLTPPETAFYRQRADDLIESQGKWFDRVRPFVPISPDTGRRTAPRWLEQKGRNVVNKISRRLSPYEPWHFALADFEHRHASLMALRGKPALYDIVLLDTLWGWPRHRLALHRQLETLAGSGRAIHSRLNWAEPSHWDGSDAAPLDKGMFPLSTGPVADYEAMLAASRLAVFASGFHWGWRNIMTLALMLGLPVVADRAFLEPWFDLDNFDIEWNDSGDWDGLPEGLSQITDHRRARIAAHNQAAFDRFLAPEQVAQYFVETALAA